MWQVLEHPPYISDLSLFDFYVLGLLEKALKGCKFGSGEDFEIAMGCLMVKLVSSRKSF
jgi:hypothetical protein